MPDTMPPAAFTLSPVVYSPEVEKIEPYEADLSQELTDTILGIAQKTYADGHHALRGVHAKSHALLSGELEVLPGLPEPLAQGIFAREARYPVIMRFSTTPGDILPDAVSTPRGLAIKIIGVEGDRLPGSEGATQDFVMVNGPAFATPNGKPFAANLKLLAGTTDRMEGVKVAVSNVLQATEKAFEAFGSTNAVVRSMGGEPKTHPLGETYFTQVPVRYGDYVAKLSLAPGSDNLSDLKGAPVDDSQNAFAIRDAMHDYFAVNDGVWDLRVQLCSDLDTMPVEDASKVWPEDQSPYVTVARLHVRPQAAWSEARSAAVDDAMSFSPWHGIEAHRPLGQIMRLRKQAYEASSAFRAQHGGARQEPVQLPDVFRDDGNEPTDVFYP